MTITITKTKFAAAVLAVVMLVPATAYATHVFDDVPDGAFYAEPVEWAFDNGITTGTSPTTFSPLDDVTRGESVTFLKRYNDNIVMPAIEEVEDSIPSIGMEGVTSDNDVDIDSTTETLIESITLDGSGTVDAVINATVRLENAGSSQARIDVSLRLDDCSGTVLAESGYRSPATSSTFINQTVAATAHADDVAGDATIALCASKTFGGSADAVSHQTSMTAVWS
ncbi:MAG: S-layer homology domain-containing protein [Actinomycetota bacterium]